MSVVGSATIFGDYVMFRDDRPAPDIRSVGLVGQIVDPGHRAPDASKVYVRFPNGRESWLIAEA